MEKDIVARIAAETGVNVKYVSNVLDLISDGATIPFIARYRKEATGGLDEVAVKDVIDRADRLQSLIKRKEFIAAAMQDAGVMTPELENRIRECFDAAVLEDIYLPFKPKRRTKAMVARERGLEPLAKQIMAQNLRDLNGASLRYVNNANHVTSAEDALAGARDIIAEWVSEHTGVRKGVRSSLSRSGVIKGKGKNDNPKYAEYCDFSRPIRSISAHSFLALRRAESEGAIKVAVQSDEEGDLRAIERRFIKSGASHETACQIEAAVKDGYKRLLLPSITNEVLTEVKERSDKRSIELFTEGLRQVLLYPPVNAQPVLALDPGFRTGCKVAMLGSQGDLLEYGVIYPVGPHSHTQEAAVKVKEWLKKYDCRLIALGDGTASRESEEFLLSLHLPDGVKIERVSEQGASIYSASEVARKEFPNLDLTIRSAVSIGRRLQDPLAELVKIDPKSIGVGQYQHDVDQSMLKDALEFTVERCVNEVGVDLNTASAELLSYVAGIGSSLAQNIVNYRKENGPFKTRRELLKVTRLGAKAFEQSSGFLRIRNGIHPLDNSAVHPERYALVERMAKDLGCELTQLIGNGEQIDRIDPHRYISDEAGMATIMDILAELHKPGRDPREAVEADWRDISLKSIDDLSEGMEVMGKVVNLTAFGAFVDLGIKQNGLIHISQMGRRRVNSAAEVVNMWQIVQVRIIGIDRERERISLSLIE